MNPETQLSQLKSVLNQYADLVAAIGLLHWDLETQMPAGGSDGRGHQLGTLTRIAHETFTSDQVGQLLDDLLPYAGQLDLDPALVAIPAGITASLAFILVTSTPTNVIPHSSGYFSVAAFAVGFRH